ncbi:VPEID-CTERM sorting domain-containing protein [Paenirhodobacter enshiensis]|uniref:VPEID-CTERM sorting domain-containing protein n=1 Tax=Paenirhodobacter enshiensis TaxID=1105367 RepID=UPI003FA2B338
MKKLFASASALIASSGAVFAGCGGIGMPCPTPTAVPEISAMEGTAALAVMAAIVLLAWERRRRAA